MANEAKAKAPAIQSTLDQLIQLFEKNYPTYNWLVRKIDSRTPKTKPKWYLASAVPTGYIARMGAPNPSIIKCEAQSPEAALIRVLDLLARRTPL